MEHLIQQRVLLCEGGVMRVADVPFLSEDEEGPRSGMRNSKSSRHSKPPRDGFMVSGVRVVGHEPRAAAFPHARVWVAAT